jgi:lipopolysaccharide/colanic/teichoic acid biosynthesis glycosyltransferase
VRIRAWEDLPDNMKNESVRKYYKILSKNRSSLVAKRIFDIMAAILTLILLSPVFIIISIAIKVDSGGPVIFRQIRVTQYGKQFKIYKFRTMIKDADKIGSQITVKNDVRVTVVGKLLRKFKLDEIPQLFNIIAGDMSFVGTRPEVVKYVEKYTEEMRATLLLPAGVTSQASIKYKDEEQLLANADDADDIYIKVVLPEKMKFNLKSIKDFSFWGEFKTMFTTVIAVTKRNGSFNALPEKPNEEVHMV